MTEQERGRTYHYLEIGRSLALMAAGIALGMQLPPYIGELATMGIAVVLLLVALYFVVKQPITGGKPNAE